MGEPLNEHVLDELLSADLDGELAAAAADRGLTVEQARDALTSPAAIARRSELARARDLVAVPVPLDPDVADRLVATSIRQGRQDNEVGAARARRARRADMARRVLVVAGSAAAVIAVIVGLANMSPSSQSDDSSAAVAPTESNADASTRQNRAPVPLGDVSDSQQLRRRIETRLRAPDVPRASGSKTTATAESSGPVDGEGSFLRDTAAKRYSAACLPATRAQAGGSAPVLTGGGTSGGRPVSVYVFRSGNAYDVVVVGRDCSVIERLSLP
jgi:hypothetical protein